MVTALRLSFAHETFTGRLTSIRIARKLVDTAVGSDWALVPRHLIWGRPVRMDFPVTGLWLLRPSIVGSKETASSPLCIIVINIIAGTVRALFILVLVGAKADRVETVQRLVEHPVLLGFHWLLVKVLQFPFRGRCHDQVVISTVLVDSVTIGVDDDPAILTLITVLLWCILGSCHKSVGEGLALH